MIHLKLALTIAAVGFVFTSKPWLQWLHTFSPEVGLLIKNMVIFFVILLLDRVDETLRIEQHTQALGVLLVYLSFVIIFNYQSDWIEDSKSDNVGDQTIDGAVYHRARTTFGLSPETARLVTFVVIPFILMLLGSKFVRNGQKIDV
jgi:hypothetical protein